MDTQKVTDAALAVTGAADDNLAELEAEIAWLGEDDESAPQGHV